MTDGDALIRACLKAPDDQAPRLVLADWLDERDDPRGLALRVSHALSFGELPEGGPVASGWGRHPEHRLACRLALVAYERRARQWKVPDLYLTTCELYACRLIDARRRDDWLKGPYQRLTFTWPPLRHCNFGLADYPRRYAMLLMRACGDCQLPFGHLPPSDRRLATSVLSAARFWIRARMFEEAKDDRGQWVGYRRFIAHPNGRKVHGEKARAYLDYNG